MAQVFGTEMSEYKLVKFWRTAPLIDVPNYIRAFSVLIKGRYEAIEATREVANIISNSWDDVLNKVITDYDIYNEIMLEGTIKANAWLDKILALLCKDLPKNEALKEVDIDYYLGNIDFEEFLAQVIEDYISEADFKKYLEAEAIREWADILED